MIRNKIILGLVLVIGLGLSTRFLFTSILRDDFSRENKMILVLVEESFSNNHTDLIKDFSEKIGKNLQAKPVIQKISKDVDSFSVKEIIQDYYINGIEIGSEKLFLIGTTIVGDVQIPILYDGTSYFQSTLPYSKFNDQNLIYQETKGIFRLINNSPTKIDSFTTIIRGSETNIISKIEKTISRNDKLENNELIIANFPASSPTKIDRLDYEKRIKHTIERIYYRFGKPLIEEISGIESKGQNDILTINQIPKLLPNLSKTFGNYLGRLRSNLKGNFVWTENQITTPEYLIDLNDTTAESTIESTQEILKLRIKELFEGKTKPIPVLESADPGFNFFSGDFDYRIFGKDVSEINSASECSIYSGDFATNDEPYNQKIEMNYAYNFGDESMFDECDILGGCCVRNTSFDNQTGLPQNSCNANLARFPVITLEGTKPIYEDEIIYDLDLKTMCNQVRHSQTNLFGFLADTNSVTNFEDIYDKSNRILKYNGNIIKQNDIPNLVSIPGSLVPVNVESEFNFKGVSSFVSMEEPTGDTIAQQIAANVPPIALPIHGRWRAKYLDFYNNEDKIPYFSWFADFNENNYDYQRSPSLKESAELLENYSKYLSGKISDLNKTIFFIKWYSENLLIDEDKKDFGKLLFGIQTNDSIKINEFEIKWNNYTNQILSDYDSLFSYFNTSQNSIIEDQAIQNLGFSPHAEYQDRIITISYDLTSEIGKIASINLGLNLIEYISEDEFLNLFDENSLEKINSYKKWMNLNLEEKYEYTIQYNQSFPDLPSSNKKNIALVNTLFNESPIILPSSNFLESKKYKANERSGFSSDEDEDLQENEDDLVCGKYQKKGVAPLLNPPDWVPAITCWAQTLGYTKELDDAEELPEELQEIQNDIDDFSNSTSTGNETNETENPFETKPIKEWRFTEELNHNSDIYLFTESNPLFFESLNYNSFGDKIYNNTESFLISGSTKKNTTSLISLVNGKLNTTNEGSLELDFSINNLNSRKIDVNKTGSGVSLFSFDINNYYKQEDQDLLYTYIETNLEIINDSENNQFIIQDVNSNVIATISPEEISGDNLNFDISVNIDEVLFVIESNNIPVLSYPIEFLNLSISEIKSDYQNYYYLTSDNFNNLILNQIDNEIIKNSSDISQNYMELIHFMGQNFTYGEALNYIEMQPSVIHYGDPAISFETDNSIDTNSFGNFIGETPKSILRFLSIGDKLIGLTNSRNHYLIEKSEISDRFNITEIEGLNVDDVNLTIGINNLDNFQTPGILTYRNNEWSYSYFERENRFFENQNINEIIFPFLDQVPNYIESSDLNNDSIDDIIFLSKNNELKISFGPDLSRVSNIDSFNFDFNEINTDSPVFTSSNISNSENILVDINGEILQFEETAETINFLGNLKQEDNKFTLNYSLNGDNSNQYIGLPMPFELIPTNLPEVICDDIETDCIYNLYQTTSQEYPILIYTEQQISEIIIEVDLSIDPPLIDIVDTNNDGLKDLIVRYIGNKKYYTYTQTSSNTFTKEEKEFENEEIDIEALQSELEDKYQSESAPEYNSEIKDIMYEDNDNDGRPDSIEVSNGSFDLKASFTGTDGSLSINDDALAEQVANFRNNLENQVSQYLGNCEAGCLPIPFNTAFLVPGYQNIWAGTTSIQGPKVQGFPVFGMPGPSPSPVCAGPACWGNSSFRLYLSPTITGAIGIAICTGEYATNVNNPSANAFFGGNCFVQVFDMPGVNEVCTLIDDQVANLENAVNEGLDNFNESLKENGGVASGSFNINGSSVSNSSPKLSVLGGGFSGQKFAENVRPPEFPAIVKPLWDLLEQFINAITDLPELYILLPSPESFRYKWNEIKDVKNFEKNEDTTLVENKEINKIPFVKVNPKSNPNTIDKSLRFISSLPFLNVKQKNINVKLPDIEVDILVQLLKELYQLLANIEACVAEFKQSTGIPYSSTSPVIQADYERTMNEIEKNREQNRKDRETRKELKSAIKSANKSGKDTTDLEQALKEEREKQQQDDNQETGTGSTLEDITDQKKYFLNGTCPAQIDLDLGALEKAERKIKNNIDTIVSWIELIESIKKYENFLYKYIGDVLDYVNEILVTINKYLIQNIRAIKHWQNLPKDIKDSLETIQLVMNINADFDTKCNNCKNERNSGSNWYFDIVAQLTGGIPVPQINFPSWPDAEVDLSALADISVDLLIPKLKIQLVPFDIPKFSQSFNLDFDLFLEIPDLPAPPSLPELPELELPEGIDIKLPAIPPAPKVPDFAAKINVALKVLEEFMNFWCLLKNGLLIVPEGELKNTIEFSASKKSFLPVLDLAIKLPTIKFGVDAGEKQVIKLTASLDATDLPGLSLGREYFNLIRDYIKESNKYVDEYSTLLQKEADEYLREKYEASNLSYSDWKPNEVKDIRNEKEISPYLYEAIAMIDEIEKDNPDLSRWNNYVENVIADLTEPNPNGMLVETFTESFKQIPYERNITTENNIFITIDGETIIINDNDILSLGNITHIHDIDSDGDIDIIFLRDNYIYFYKNDEFEFSPNNRSNFSPYYVN